jgi:transcriptional regulator with PAS, ATPase and Fis domain
MIDNLTLSAQPIGVVSRALPLGTRGAEGSLYMPMDVTTTEFEEAARRDLEVSRSTGLGGSPHLTRPGAPPKVVHYPKTRIAIASGPNRGYSIEAAGIVVRVGTSTDNDIVLDDHTVSRRHCEIDLTNDGIRIRDTHSRNGVFTSGMRIYDAVLTGPVTIEIGETSLTITPLTDTVMRMQAHADRFGEILGQSPRMRELFADLERIAATDLSVLIEGETGTGKDLIAESIHRASPRGEQPFVVFDCGAVAPTLAESELFGHERGAFTGAVAARAGVFELANGGTLFIDEFGELGKELQPKLLRVLERQEVRRVGGSTTIPVNVRIVAATNRNLNSEVQRGAFRQDLFFRIAGAHVSVPPLRDRTDDLPLLVEHFLSQEDPPRPLSVVPAVAWEMFRAYNWPGNVRELRNAVRRLLVTPERALGPISVAAPRATPADGAAAGLGARALMPMPIARREANEAFEKAYIEAALERAQGSVTRAAAAAEVSRQFFTKLLHKHGLRSNRSSGNGG